MLANERQRRQDELVKKIYALSEAILQESEIRRTALELRELYTPDFRHSYSEFFPVILKIDEENKYSIDFLSNNIEQLRLYVENDYIEGTNEFKDMHKSFDKLCDHLNLEISRVSYFSQNNQKTADLSNRMENLSIKMDEATQKLVVATKKAESIQSELISVLSIFAAIVIAFSGGLSLLGNALSIASNTYICKIILILLICGFVLFNTIFLLMYLVGKLTGRSVFADCEMEFCNCKVDGKAKCGGIKKVVKRLPYVFYFNLFVTIFVIIDIVVWCLDRWVI
ncbi:MAG: hypothetical protein KH230_25575 [Enterocloster asparagiformis]|nr:hypothetical protein [Enterocloster asparagiformis]